MKRFVSAIGMLLAVAVLASCVATAEPSTGTTGQLVPDDTGSTASSSTAASALPSTAATTVPTSTAPTTAPTTQPTTVPVTTAPTVPATTAPTQPPAAEPIVALTGKFYTYDEMVSDLMALTARYPEKLRYQVYGKSADDRDLYAAVLGNTDAQKQVIITAGMHAREYINPYLLMLQLEYYLENYYTGTYNGKSMSDLFDRVAFVVVPMTNPDGITLTQEGISAIRSPQLQEIIRGICRKNGVQEANMDYWVRTYWKSNAAGVDLNRNFDALWNEHLAEPGGSPVTEVSHQYYKGPTANSEPETYHLIQLTESLSNPVTSVCVHSRGQIVYWRCFQEGAFEAENLALAKLARSITGYGIVDENQTEPSYSNWTILAHGIPTITVETGAYIAYPHDIASMIDTIYRQNRDLWIAIADAYA